MKKHLLFIFFLLFAKLFFICVHAMENSEPFQAESDLSRDTFDAGCFLEYRETGGMDHYKAGDQAGEILRIYPSGRAELFNLIYTQDLKETKYMEQFAGLHTFSEQKISEIQKVINANNIGQWPEHLPDVSPLVARFRTPAPSVRIFYKNQQTGEEIYIKATMGADKKHYPDGFFRIYSLLSSLVQEVRNRPGNSSALCL